MNKKHCLITIKSIENQSNDLLINLKSISSELYTIYGILSKKSNTLSSELDILIHEYSSLIDKTFNSSHKWHEVIYKYTTLTKYNFKVLGDSIKSINDSLNN